VSTPRKGGRDVAEAGRNELDDQVHISFSLPASVAAQTDIAFTFSPRRSRILRTDDGDDARDFVPTLLKFDKHDNNPVTSVATSAAPTSLTHRSTNTFGQQDFSLAPAKLFDLDEICAPDPVYPRVKGTVHPMDPLPESSIAPMKYYVVWKGLKIGIFYDVW
jgi:hypothetical protein